VTMRVLMLVRDHSWFGGVVNFVKSLEINLSDNVDTIEFRIGQRKGARGKWFQLIVPLFDAARLAWLVIWDRYDIVHINPSLNIKSLVRDTLFLLVLRLRGIKNTVIFIHGWEESAAVAIENSALLKKIFVTLFGGAAVIYVLAKQFKSRLEAWGVDPNRVHVVTTMFDGRQFSGITRNRDDDEIRVLFLSRFVREKGIYELLEAFSRLHEHFPGLVLVLAGAGPEEVAMVKWVENAGLSESVTFTGYIRDKEKAQVLMDADIFVFPTYYGEGCPVSLLEAMAAGLPVITSSTGGIGDLIVDGRNGRLLETVTTAKVEDAMLDLLANLQNRKAISEYNRQFAWEYYEAAVVSKDIEAMYNNIVGRG
jgi:glycosyltransferase involved in cell wall biosynthesis